MAKTITLCPLSYGSKIPFFGKQLTVAVYVDKLERELKNVNFEKFLASSCITTL